MAEEAFDKSRLCYGVSYPEDLIDALATEGNPDVIELRRFLVSRGNFEFSFSGLKSVVLNYLNSKSQKVKT